MLSVDTTEKNIQIIGNNDEYDDAVFVRRISILHEKITDTMDLVNQCFSFQVNNRSVFIIFSWFINFYYYFSTFCSQCLTLLVLFVYLSLVFTVYIVLLLLQRKHLINYPSYRLCGPHTLWLVQLY